MDIPIPNHNLCPANLSHIYDEHLWTSCATLSFSKKPKKTWALNFEDLDKAGKHGSTPLLLVLGVCFGVFESYG